MVIGEPGTNNRFVYTQPNRITPADYIDSPALNWSADGRIAFYFLTAQGGILNVFDTQRKERMVVTSRLARPINDSAYVQRTPDGSGVVYRKRLLQSTRLVRYDFDSQKKTRIADDVTAWSLSPTGWIVYAFEQSDQIGVSLTKTDASETHEIIPLTETSFITY